MEKKKIGFNGENYLERSLEDYKGEWILIGLNGNGSYIGVLSELSRKEVGLMPYQKVTYTDAGYPNYEISYEGLPNIHERRDVVSFRPASEAEAKNFCKYMNQKTYLEHLREKKEISELEKINSQIEDSKKKIIKP